MALLIAFGSAYHSRLNASTSLIRSTPRLSLRGIAQFLCPNLSEKFSLLFRRERGDDFFEARIAAGAGPKWGAALMSRRAQRVVGRRLIGRWPPSIAKQCPHCGGHSFRILAISPTRAHSGPLKAVVKRVSIFTWLWALRFSVRAN